MPAKQLKICEPKQKRILNTDLLQKYVLLSKQGCIEIDWQQTMKY